VFTFNDNYLKSRILLVWVWWRFETQCDTSSRTRRHTKSGGFISLLHWVAFCY